MIFKNEVFQNLVVGQHIKGFIKTVRKDHKIDLTLQKSGYQKIDYTSQNILDKIKQLDGSIPVTDKSPPGQIYAMFGVSKKTFKKAYYNQSQQHQACRKNKRVTGKK
jgi:predicted RNA-binding protein (virulence factor B family)